MIPNHIKIGNAGKILSQYISENNFSKIGFLSDNNSSKYCLNRILENHKFDYIRLQLKKERKIKAYLPVKRYGKNLLTLNLTEIPANKCWRWCNM